MDTGKGRGTGRGVDQTRIGVSRMTSCDTCGVKVSTKGYLGGGIVCKTCARAKNQGDVDTLRERIERYGGGDDYDGQDPTELVY